MVSTWQVTFRLRPRTLDCRGIISVGQVCDRGNLITFRRTGGTILNEFAGSLIEFDRAVGVYRLKADASTRTKTGIHGVKILMGFE